MRIEKDILGEMPVPDDALYGIHTLRACSNFPVETRFSIDWFKAMATVKKSCYITANAYFRELEKNYPDTQIPVQIISEDILTALQFSANECETGRYFEHFKVPAISGGAGTSINMNVNEIITNLALAHMGKPYGTYSFIDPLEQANIFQSTNDVVPTALRVAAMQLLNRLEESINLSRSAVEDNEKKFRNILRLGYTQMQEAVPTTYGRLFSTYSDALSRDWWRVSKCSERIKVVNLGGSAIGTSIAVPKYFVSEVVRTLQTLTGLPVSKGENLADTTSNLDVVVEVHATLKAHAVNLEKMVNDLRLLSSELIGNKEMSIPRRQAGSSIMPGKINPVIPEFVISSTHTIYANDQLISSLCAQGCLELNAYLPTIGHALLESLNLLIACNETIRLHLLTGLEINKKVAELKVFNSPSITTALIPYIGYHKASELANYMKSNNADIYSANRALSIIGEDKLTAALLPEKLLQAGYRMKDILE